MTQLGTSASRHIVQIPGRPGVRIILAWGAATDTGNKRRHNEDSFLAESPIFVVADGLGGHSAGDVASAAVVTRLAEANSGDFTDADSVDEALAAAAADIAMVADDKELGVGTTVSGAVLTLQAGEPYWTVFNIGDSRVYLFEEGELTQVTVDHSVVQGMVDAGLIRAEDAEFHPDSNVITRAVGFDGRPAPDYWVIPARTGMRLLLCSDGLSKEVDHRQLSLLLGSGRGAEDTADALVAAALAAGGRDNVTVVVVDVLENTGSTERNDTAVRDQSTQEIS
jgi:serine/threonine protein phosphatase PrpC